MPNRLLSSLLGTLAISAAFSHAAIDPANDAANDAQNDSNDSAHSVIAPLVKWTFDEAEPGKWQGTKKIEPSGPQTPAFPDFKAGNKAAYFSGKDSSITIKEADLPQVNLRFRQGDSITMEAWVNPESLKDGAYLYILGKGRHRHAGFPSDNQNYSLRIKGQSSNGVLCFLFRSEQDNTPGDHWHRWTSTEGFVSDASWHHVAVAYTFGKPDSIIGYVDGKKLKGAWDMGGQTDKPPVNDGDDLMIGTGNGGGASNSFKGWLDEVAIYRDILPDTVLAQRYHMITPPPVVEAKSLPKDKVRVEICENGVPDHNNWPALPLKATEHYDEDAFGIFEVPHKYVDTGVRGDRGNPFMVRAAAVIKLPAGKHRLLLRARSAARLFIDGQPAMTLPFMTADSSGHGHVAEQKAYLDLGPDFRFAPPGTQEKWCELEIGAKDAKPVALKEEQSKKKGKSKDVASHRTESAGLVMVPQTEAHLIVVEQIVGGGLSKTKRRPETGEMVVAISKEGNETWELLSPGETRIAYTDASWAAYEAEHRQHLDSINAQHRAEQRATTATYWDKRRKAAADWLAASPEVKVPASPSGAVTNNEIDKFINAKIAEVTAQNAESQSGTVNFFRDIQPILETKCFDCHRGSKVKGGLRLDSLADAQKGGKDNGPAIVSGHPDQSALLKRVNSKDQDEVMPPKGDPLTAGQIKMLTQWISEGAHWPEIRVDNVKVTPLADDLTFLRRVTLDTVGVTPSLAEIEAFTNDKSTDKRARVIDRLLQDPRWADHWMGYWQDVLAENPNMLNPTLNNTGPFRWWIYESLLDDKPMDLFVTELIRMRGSERSGGPAGFSTASQNDVPMAAKGTIVSTAFLGVEMKCARCHDAPSHKSTQENLFQLAAMLKTQALEVPKTSSVSLDRFVATGRKPLITVALKPGAKIEPKWPFSEFCPEALGRELAEDEKDSRDRLAALVTAPQNERFAQVIANRVWARFMGRGIVEPIADWEKGRATHPELLKWLGREFVRHGYQVKDLARIILNSQTYQRATDNTLRESGALFAAPAPRRLAAEQIVDSLFAATGKPFRLEEVSLDIDGRRDVGSSVSLGQPRRSWMLTSTSNERDRPSLALPRIQAVCDVLQAFGWRGSRQDPTTKRETDPNALQPAILSNGTVATWLTRLSDDHGIVRLAMEDKSLDQFIDALFLQLLTRKPTAEERQRYNEHLRDGFAQRRITSASSSLTYATASPRQPAKYVSWSNHLDPEATLVRQEQEAMARQGDPPTDRLAADWRQRLEDVLWAMLNAPEWVFAP